MRLQLPLSVGVDELSRSIGREEDEEGVEEGGHEEELQRLESFHTRDLSILR